MNKLTAEVARQDLNHLKSWVETCGISMKEERYMQALEIALPILEQQEMITDSQPVITDSAGMIMDSFEQGEGEWIDWGGGEQPLQRMDFCEIRFRNGEQASGMAYCWVWNHSGENDDIIAYKMMDSRQQPVKPKRGGGF